MDVKNSIATALIVLSNVFGMILIIAVRPDIEFKIGIPLRGIARNCAELRATVFELGGRKCAEFTGLAIVRK